MACSCHRGGDCRHRRAVVRCERRGDPGIRASLRRRVRDVPCTAATAPETVWQDAATNVVFVLTRHDLHAAQTLSCLQAGKHVFVEKPLAITPEQLTEFARGLARFDSEAVRGRNLPKEELVHRDDLVIL